MKIETIDHQHAIGTSDSLMLCLWRKSTTIEAVGELHSISQGLVSRSAGKVGFLTVVESTADLVDGVVRDELAKMFRGVSASVACSALVFEGEGFRAAAVRAITTTINQVARQPFPHKVFGRVDDASHWMGGLLPNVRLERIQRDLDQLRLSLDHEESKSA